MIADPEFAGIKLRDLNEAHLRAWQRRLGSLAGTTKDRILSDLKAALNAAFEEHRQALPSDLPVTIKHGLKPVFVVEGATAGDVARDNQILEDDEIRALLKEGSARDEDGDHFLLAVVLAATDRRS